MSAPVSIHATPTQMMVFIDARLAPCTMACTFCKPMFKPWDRRPEPDAALTAEVVAAVEAALAEHKPPQIDLVSDDILAFPRLDELLAAAQHHGAAIRLVTAGLRLADPKVAERVAAMPVRVVLTLLSQDPARYARIAGRVDAHAAVHEALKQVHAHRIPLDLGIVVLHENVAELPELVREARANGCEKVAVRLFHPDVHGAGPEYFVQYPNYDDVHAALRVLAASAEALPRVEVTNLPWCALDPEGLDGLDLMVLNPPNAVRYYDAPACSGCPVRERCPGLHAGYHRQHGHWPRHAAHVVERTAWADGLSARRGRSTSEHVEPEDVQPLFRAQVVPGEEVELSVGQKLDGFGYFFTTDTLGCYYRGSFRDPSTLAAFRTAVQAAVRPLRQAKPEELGADALVAAMEAVIASTRHQLAAEAPPS